MNDVGPISGVGGAARVRGKGVSSERPGQRAEGAVARRGADQVEVSGMARLLAKLRELPEVRQGLVDRVRREIESGVYDTPEKLDAALDRLIDEQRGAG